MTGRVQAWLRQASSDLEAARLMQAQGLHAQACYHAAQAAEKALKGLLLACGTTPPYSHAHDQLVGALAALGLDTTSLGELHLKALARMNSETRYPLGDEAPVDQFDARDSQPALHMAEKVLAYVSRTMATSDPPT